MTTKIFYVVLVFLHYTTVQALTIIDLTHKFDNTTAYWQMKDQIVLTPKGSADPYYETNTLCASEHGGTHLDAPRHFAKGKQGAHEVPLDRMIGTPYIVDVSEEAKTNADLLISVAHLTATEKSKGRIPDDSIMLLYTGSSLKWNNLTDYFGGDPTNATKYHFPGLDPTAAQWLVDNRKIASIGIDTPSMDYGQSTSFQSHVILSTQNIPMFENVDLSQIDTFADKEGVLIFALPMKITNGSGAPLRIIASIPESKKKASAAVTTLTSLYFVAMVTIINLILL